MMLSKKSVNCCKLSELCRVSSGLILGTVLYPSTAEINYEILAIEDGSSINGVVKKIENSDFFRRLPENKIE